MSDNRIVYLDNAATTKVDEEVLRVMNEAEKNYYFNSSALYNGSANAKREITRATSIIGEKLSRTHEGVVVFTSGATEGNNIAMLGKIGGGKSHLLVASGEHSSVYSPSVMLKNMGHEVDYVPLKSTGEIDEIALKRLVRPTTAFFVFGMVNSDTGALQNAKALVSVVRAVNPRIHVHIDAVQAFCKFDFDIGMIGADTCVVSSHKIYGPKGVGALWIRKGTSLRPIMYGGSQQDYRPGTENNASIIGFARAVERFDTVAYYKKISTLHEILVKGLPENCKINGLNINPYITNILLPNVQGQHVLNILNTKNIYVGLGSACSSRAAKNRTLLAMGIPEPKTKHVLRISLGINNTQEDIKVFLTELNSALLQLIKK